MATISGQHGTIESNAMTCTALFRPADGSEPIRLTLTGPADDEDQGYYRCRDTDGREWLLADFEDRAELYSIREGEHIGEVPPK